MNRYPVLSFTGIAFAISWTIWAPLLRGNSMSHTNALLLYYAGVIGPALAAFLCADSRALLLRIRHWRIPLTWFGLAMVVPLVIRGLAVGAAVGWSVEVRPVAAIARTTALMVLLVPFEEIGWRGHLLPVLQHRYAPLAASLVVGIIWALWHAPLAWATVGYQQSAAPWTYLLWFTLSILPISCLATWLFNRSGQSIAVVSLFHLTVNLADFVVVLPRSVGMLVLMATTILTTLLVGCIFARDRHLGLHSRTGATPRTVALDESP